MTYSRKENAIIIAQQLCLRLSDRFEISDAHGLNHEIRIPNDETMTKPENRKDTF